MRAPLCLLFMLLAPLTSVAAQYYVSPSGKDTNSGTLVAPWLTGDKAQTVVHPGDTVFFRSGVYSNCWIHTTHGTSNAPITFKAYLGETPQILVTNSTITEALAIWVNYYVIDGFSISGGYNGISVNSGTNNIIQNCDVHDCYVGGITAGYNSEHTTIRNCRVYNSSIENWPRTNSSWGGAINLQTGSHNSTVDNCVVYFVHGEGIIAASVNNCTIRNCIVADNWHPHILIDAENTLLENNIVFTSRAGAQLNPGNDPGIGISVTLEQTDAYENTYASHGIYGTRVVNNLIVSCGEGIRGGQIVLYKTNRNYSNCFYANNSIISPLTYGFHFDNGNNPPDSNPYGENFDIINNLYVTQLSGNAAIQIHPITNFAAGTFNIGNNLWLYNHNAGFLWNSNYWYTQQGQLPYWQAASGETNGGPYKSVWISDTTSANTIIPNVWASAAAMPRLWTTNNIPPDINVDSVFSDLSTCSNRIFTLRKIITDPFRPVGNSLNPVIHSGQQIPIWTYVTDHGMTNTVRPLTTDLLGNARSGEPTLGALNQSPSAASNLQILSPGP